MWPPAPASFSQDKLGHSLPSHGKHFDRVLIIVLENQRYNQALKDPVLSRLASEGANFTNFKAILHPSYPNYLALIAGSTFGTHSDTQVDFPDDSQHRTIGDFLDWKAYAEDYPPDPRPFLGDRSGRYARKHEPFLSFQKIQKHGFENVIGVNTHDLHNAFVADIENFRKDPKKYPLPRFMFYTPNLDDDGHDPPLRPAVGLRKASQWLENFLQNWLVLDDKMKGTLVVVTYDESQGYESSNRIFTVFLGDMVKAGEVSEPYDHYSILRTIEDNFGIAPLQPSGDGAAKVIEGIWK
jgi:hypothetical protein